MNDNGKAEDSGIESFILRFDMDVAALVRSHNISKILGGEEDISSTGRLCGFPKLLKEVIPTGVWVTASYNKDGVQKVIAHSINEDCCGYRENDTLVSSWVLSESFINNGFIEPMNELLFLNAKNKYALIVTRMGRLIIVPNDRDKIESFNLLSPETLEKVKICDGDIGLARDSFLKQGKNPDSYDNLSKTIKGIVTKIFSDNDRKITDSALKSVLSFIRDRPDISQKDVRKLTNGLLESLIWNRLLDLKYDTESSGDLSWSNIFYVPESLSFGIGTSGIICAVDCEDSNETLIKVTNILSVICNRFFAPLYFYSHLLTIKRANTKSAIGSIMSRNGSHNIGSHVLAALSHNVGTMPDDRVLYQYIQQRMDYMASATTDFQDWSVPTSFVGELMKHFYSQYHLLEHIAGSEGLHAYRYQGKPISLAGGKNLDTHCIKVNVRRIVGKDKDTNGYRHCVVGGLECWLYDFFKAGNVEESFKNDVSVAIPGGVLGQHAFYNIIENVIRNAAKHSWTRQKCHAPNENLDIFIDLADGDFGCRKDLFAEESIALMQQMVSVTIGDGLSRIFDNVEFWKHFLSSEVAGKYVSVAEKNGVDLNLGLWDAYASLVDCKSEDCKKAIIDELAKLKRKPSANCVVESKDEEMGHALKRAFALPISSLASDKSCDAVRNFIAEGSTTSPKDLPPQYRVLYAYLLNEVKPERGADSHHTGRWIVNGDNNGNHIVIGLSLPPPADSDDVGNRLILPLHHRQEIELSKPFIDPVSNKLKQSGWGLAEMKISAGYLRRASFDVVGGLEADKKYELPLIVPMGVPPLGEENYNENKEGDNSQQEVQSDLLDLRLAYRIWMERPKKVLMLVDEDSTWKNWCGATDPKSGCSVKLLSEALEKVGLMSDFGVVVIDRKQKI